MEILPSNELKPEDLLKIANMTMPFGKYKGRTLIDLPETYVVWFCKNGLPKGEIGRLMAQLYEIKANGLEYLFNPLRGAESKQALKARTVKDLKSYRF